MYQMNTTIGTSPQTGISLTPLTKYAFHLLDRRDFIIEVINKIFIATTNGKGIPQFFVDSIDLEAYTTKSSDKKKGIIRMPNESTQIVRKKILFS